MDATATANPPTVSGATPLTGATPANRSLLVVAATASGAAGLVHAAAAGTHAGDRTLVVLFAITAAIQLGWGVLAMVRPARTTASVGIAINALCFGAWVASRTVGLPLIDSLAEVEDAGTQDIVAAVLAVLATTTAALAIVPAWTRRRFGQAWVGAGAFMVLALAVPGMAAEHAHTASHEHSDGSADEAHVHDASEDSGTSDATASSDAEHSHGSGGDETAAGHAHGDVPARLDHDPTDAQKEAARDLIAETEAGLARFTSVDDAVAAGYRSIGDGRRVGGYEHFINQEYLANATILDATQPESLVFRHNADGSKELTTAMYILPPGSTMDDVPDIAGNLTVWHGHDNLCFDPASGRLAGRVSNGQCVPAGVQGGNVPMLHVWVTSNECGPFAGTDSQSMTGSCVTDF